MVCPPDKGLSQCGQEGKRSIFRDFLRTSFMDGLLAVSAAKCLAKKG